MHRGFVEGLLCVVLFAWVIPAPVSSAETDEIRVYVNGRRVVYDVQPFEMTEGGRLMVQVKPTVTKMGCTRITWDNDVGRVRVLASADCSYTAHAYINLYPREQSRTVELFDGFNPVTPFTRYELDAPVMIVNGHTVAPARILADAFRCFSWWVEETQSFHINCDRPNRLHEDLSAVIDNNPPIMGMDGTFKVPEGSGGYRMYPKTLEQYELLLDMSRKITGSVEQETAHRLKVEYDTPNRRARIYDEKRTHGFVYGDYSAMVLDMRQVLTFEHRLTAMKNKTSIASGAVGALVGVWIPGIQYTWGKAVASALLSLVTGGGVTKLQETDINAFQTCVKIARYDAKQRGEPEDSARVTVGLRWPANVACIPHQTDKPMPWKDFAREGIRG